jgi:hypothetical protein
MASINVGPSLARARSTAVKINGRRLPAVDRHNAVVDVSHHLRTGTNTIDVEVATTLRNRLRTLDEYTEFATVERQPYGLVGPVRLVPFGEAAIRTEERSA